MSCKFSLLLLNFAADVDGRLNQTASGRVGSSRLLVTDQILKAPLVVRLSTSFVFQKVPSALRIMALVCTWLTEVHVGTVVPEQQSLELNTTPASQ